MIEGIEDIIIGLICIIKERNCHEQRHPELRLANDNGLNNIIKLRLAIGLNESQFVYMGFTNRSHKTQGAHLAALTASASCPYPYHVIRGIAYSNEWVISQKYPKPAL